MKQSPELPDDERGQKRVRWIWVMLIVGVILGLTHDIIITNILAYWNAMGDTSPKTFIKRTVDFPESVYWEDNVYHGYNEEERLLMIQGYLDGVHLKTMALNGPDGEVYLYTATDNDWPETLRLKKNLERQGFNYEFGLINEAKVIANRGKVLTRSELPQLNYSVVVNSVLLSQLQSGYLYSDEIVITDLKIKEVIAYNRRLMRFYYRFQLEPMGGCRSLTKLSGKSFYGLADLYGLDDQSILRYKKLDGNIYDYKCRKTYQSVH